LNSSNIINEEGEHLPWLADCSLLSEAWGGDQQALAEVYAESVLVCGILGQVQGRAHLAQFLQACRHWKKLIVSVQKQYAHKNKGEV
jgi:hypothetical protein